MEVSVKQLKQRLKRSGYSDSVIAAAWPTWWEDGAKRSRSAWAELHFALSRKLGLDPRALLHEGIPKQVWSSNAKFKNLSDIDGERRNILSSFGVSIGKALLGGVDTQYAHEIPDAKAIRGSIMRTSANVGLKEILTVCWGLGIPVIHLRIHPLKQKAMCAMSVKTEKGYAILVARDSRYPSPIAFYVAHELAHISLGHLENDMAIVDLGDLLSGREPGDREEFEADRFALELLTGTEMPEVVPTASNFTARQLADNVLNTGRELGIEPGTLALCCGFTTGEWSIANSALKYIYSDPRPVWEYVNLIAIGQLDWQRMSDQVGEFLKAVLGGVQ